MAQSYQTDSGELTIPGAYPAYTVVAGSTGLSATGIVAIVGEATSGPDFTAEANLNLNNFGPDQSADVIAKYGSGPLVDAYLQVCVPANDPQIVGSPSSIILVKTNVGSRASAILPTSGGSSSPGYSPLAAKLIGKAGNYYAAAIKTTAEVVPTTGAFTFLPPVGTLDIALSVNGLIFTPTEFTAGTAPDAFVSAIAGLDASLASTSGGVNRSVVSAGMVSGDATVAITLGSGKNIVLTLAVVTPWSVTPSVGDTFIIPSTSVLAGAGNANCGYYVVTAATGTTINAVKVHDLNSITPAAPVAVSATALVSTSADMLAYSKVTISQATDTVIDGYGKGLEIADLGTGAALLSQCAYVGIPPVPVSWISTQNHPNTIFSSVESSVELDVYGLGAYQETIDAGGTDVLEVGYNGTSATLTITAKTLSTTVAGGTGANFSVPLGDFSTIVDLANYIGSQPGYVCEPVSNVLGNSPVSALDYGTFNICSTYGAAGSIKNDAQSFFAAVTADSAVVQLGTPVAARASAGLPGATQGAPIWLTGGSCGATSDSIVNSAFSALENVLLNFIVPCFSRDATFDIVDGLTDVGSSYHIQNTNAVAKQHVLKMSTLKKRRQRQAFCSVRDTFIDSQEMAAAQSTHRVSMTFQDATTLNSVGALTQQQPWMGAATAAGMQAAGFYRAIFGKGANVNGIVDAAGDYNYLDDDQVTEALDAGLLPMTVDSTLNSGFGFVSDQTTYSKDNNFVYNSIQAVYCADVISLTVAQAMEARFKGESLADVSATSAVTFLESVMEDLLRLKLIATSDDAPAGFKNIVIKISGPVMLVTFEVKLASALYFIPINFQISQVTQTATS